MEQNKIFIVTSGDYSDYRIERVFSTRKKALEFLDTTDSDYRLEVYNIDEPVEREQTIFCISFGLEKKKVFNIRIPYQTGLENLIRVTKYGSWDNVLEIYVKTDSKKRALKIASERYGAIIANEQTMYPYLRCKVVGYNQYPTNAFYDFNTGELVLLKGQRLNITLPDFIKVKQINEDED